MINKLNKFYIKVLLVFVVEVIVALGTHMVFKNILSFDPPLLVYVIEGSAFAIITVVLYDKLMQKKKKRVEKELKELTDVVFKKYDKKGK
ncbi:hypothetical protein 015DV004_209 [Bacillus phage 015DV004]|nr:hypothetical protein 015DV004_209 [Bacillus phage 015DV004]